MLTINLHYVRALFNPYLRGEVHIHDDANAEEALNRVLQKTSSCPNYLWPRFKRFLKFCQNSKSIL